MNRHKNSGVRKEKISMIFFHLIYVTEAVFTSFVVCFCFVAIVSLVLFVLLLCFHLQKN